MSARLEGIVRPFQTNDVRPPKRVVSTSQQDVENVILALGKTGSGKSLNGSYNYTQTKYMDTKLKEYFKDPT